MSVETAPVTVEAAGSVARWQDRWTSVGLLILRLGIGGFLITHGWGKLQMVLGGQFEQFGDPIGLGPTVSLVLITGAEFFCALLVMLGLGTRFAAIPVVIGMGVAALVAHGGDPWTSGEGARLFMSGQAQSWASKEPAMVFLVAFLGFAFTGAGRYSVDALIGPRLRRRRHAAAHPAR